MTFYTILRNAWTYLRTRRHRNHSDLETNIPTSTSQSSIPNTAVAGSTASASTSQPQTPDATVAGSTAQGASPNHRNCTVEEEGDDIDPQSSPAEEDKAWERILQILVKKQHRIVGEWQGGRYTQAATLAGIIIALGANFASDAVSSSNELDMPNLTTPITSPNQFATNAVGKVLSSGRSTLANVLFAITISLSISSTLHRIIVEPWLRRFAQVPRNITTREALAITFRKLKAYEESNINFALTVGPIEACCTTLTLALGLFFKYLDTWKLAGASKEDNANSFLWVTVFFVLPMVRLFVFSVIVTLAPAVQCMRGSLHSLYRTGPALLLLRTVMWIGRALKKTEETDQKTWDDYDICHCKLEKKGVCFPDCFSWLLVNRMDASSNFITDMDLCLASITTVTRFKDFVKEKCGETLSETIDTDLKYFKTKGWERRVLSIQLRQSFMKDEHRDLMRTWVMDVLDLYLPAQNLKNPWTEELLHKMSIVGWRYFDPSTLIQAKDSVTKAIRGGEVISQRSMELGWKALQSLVNSRPSSDPKLSDFYLVHVADYCDAVVIWLQSTPNQRGCNIICAKGLQSIFPDHILPKCGSSHVNTFLGIRNLAHFLRQNLTLTPDDPLADFLLGAAGLRCECDLFTTRSNLDNG